MATNEVLGRRFTPNVPRADRTASDVTPGLGEFVWDTDDNQLYIGIQGAQAGDPNRWAPIDLGALHFGGFFNDGRDYNSITRAVTNHAEVVIVTGGTQPNYTNGVWFSPAGSTTYLQMSMEFAQILPYIESLSNQITVLDTGDATNFPTTANPGDMLYIRQTQLLFIALTAGGATSAQLVTGSGYTTGRGITVDASNNNQIDINLPPTDMSALEVNGDNQVALKRTIPTTHNFNSLEVDTQSIVAPGPGRIVVGGVDVAIGAGSGTTSLARTYIRRSDRNSARELWVEGSFAFVAEDSTVYMYVGMEPATNTFQTTDTGINVTAAGVATIEFTTPHGQSVGDTFTLLNAVPDALNIPYTVTSITSPTVLVASCSLRAATVSTSPGSFTETNPHTTVDDDWQPTNDVRRWAQAAPNGTQVFSSEGAFDQAISPTTLTAQLRAHFFNDPNSGWVMGIRDDNANRTSQYLALRDGDVIGISRVLDGKQALFYVTVRDTATAVTGFPAGQLVTQIPFNNDFPTDFLQPTGQLNFVWPIKNIIDVNDSIFFQDLRARDIDLGPDGSRVPVSVNASGALTVNNNPIVTGVQPEATSLLTQNAAGLMSVTTNPVERDLTFGAGHLQVQGNGLSVVSLNGANQLHMNGVPVSSQGFTGRDHGNAASDSASRNILNVFGNATTSSSTSTDGTARIFNIIVGTPPTFSGTSFPTGATEGTLYVTPAGVPGWRGWTTERSDPVWWSYGNVDGNIGAPLNSRFDAQTSLPWCVTGSDVREIFGRTLNEANVTTADAQLYAVVGALNNAFYLHSPDSGSRGGQSTYVLQSEIGSTTSSSVPNLRGRLMVPTTLPAGLHVRRQGNYWIIHQTFDNMLYEEGMTVAIAS